MTIKIEPIKGARRITKADVEKQQDFEKIDKITDEEWEEAINIGQNTENLSVFFKDNLLSFYLPFRKNVFAVFYNHYQEMVDLNTSNLEELYDIFFNYAMELMPGRFAYVTGSVRAIKSEFEWEKNKSENLDLLLKPTEKEKIKIGETAPTNFVFDIEKLKDAIIRQKGKKPEELKFTRDEAESMIQTFFNAGEQRKKSAETVIELYSIMVSEIMDIYRFNISHLTDKEITSLRVRFIQDIYDFMSDIVNKINEFVNPDIMHRQITIKE